MEADFREVVAGHLKDVVTISEEDIATVFVSGHELIFALFEGSEGFFVVALYPASFVETYRFPTTLCAVFMKQTILDHLKLKLTNCADNLSAVKLISEHLSHTFVHQLADTLVKLFGFHRVGILDILEHLG